MDGMKLNPVVVQFASSDPSNDSDPPYDEHSLGIEPMLDGGHIIMGTP